MTVFTPTVLAKAIDIPAVVTVHYFEYAKDYVFEGESHDFWELLYVDKGEVEVMADKTGYRLRQGDMIFHKPGEFHNVFANGVVAPNLVVVAFLCESPGMRYFEGKILRTGADERELLARLVNEARDAFSCPLDDPHTTRMERAGGRAGSQGILFGQETLRQRSGGAGHRLYGGKRRGKPHLLGGLPLFGAERDQPENHLQSGHRAGRDGILPHPQN